MDEPALILHAQRGDLNAFNRLVLEYQTLAYNLAYRVLGETDAAADATQEAFISAYRNVNSYRGGSFKAWLLRIVTNACYDELRRRKRRPVTSLEALTILPEGPDAESEALLIQDGGTPEQLTEQKELATAIQHCLDALPDEMRVVAVMADVQGYDYSEISASAKMPLGTVKSRLARARAKLRDCLQNVRELLPKAFRLENDES